MVALLTILLGNSVDLASIESPTNSETVRQTNDRLPRAEMVPR